MKPTPEKVTIAQSQIKKINGFGWWPDYPDRFFVNADIEGYPTMSWAELPSVSRRARREAQEQGIGLGDVADNWNRRLNEEDKQRREASGFPSFTISGSLTEEQVNAIVGNYFPTSPPFEVPPELPDEDTPK